MVHVILRYDQDARDYQWIVTTKDNPYVLKITTPRKDVMHVRNFPLLNTHDDDPHTLSEGHLRKTYNRIMWERRGGSPMQRQLQEVMEQQVTLNQTDIMSRTQQEMLATQVLTTSDGEGLASEFVVGADGRYHRRGQAQAAPEQPLNQTDEKHVNDAQAVNPQPVFQPLPNGTVRIQPYIEPAPTFEQMIKVCFPDCPLQPLIPYLWVNDSFYLEHQPNTLDLHSTLWRENQSTVNRPKVFHPTLGQYVVVSRSSVVHALSSIHIDMVNCVLKHDDRLLKTRMLEHQMSRGIFASEMSAIVETVPVAKSNEANDVLDK